MELHIFKNKKDHFPKETVSFKILIFNFIWRS